jgi:hypothetical protein
MAVGAWHQYSPACRGMWQVGTAFRRWLAAFFPSSKVLQQRGRGGRKAGRMEELFQLPDALSMNPLQPVLAGGPVGTAVLGQLAALDPLLKDPLLEPFAEEGWRRAWRAVSKAHTSFVRVRHGLSWQWAGSAQLVGATWRCSPSSHVSLARTSAREDGRTAGWRQGTDRGTTEFRKGESRPGGAVRWPGGACCV